MWYSRSIVLLLLVGAGVGGLFTSLYVHHPHVYTPSFTPINGATIHLAHYPLHFVDSLKNDPNAGKKIVAVYCALCHAEHPEIPLNAPRIGYPTDWLGFKKLPPDLLFKLVSEGHGAMPARGGCFECSDKELKAAMDYLMNHTPHNPLDKMDHESPTTVSP